MRLGRTRLRHRTVLRHLSIRVVQKNKRENGENKGRKKAEKHKNTQKNSGKKGVKKGEVFQEREDETVRHLTLRVVHKQNRASQKMSRFKTPSDVVDDASHGVNG